MRTIRQRGAVGLRGAMLALGLVLAAACTADDAQRPDAAQVKPAYEAGTLFVDVRTDAEWNAGHVKGAEHLPLDQVAARAQTVLPAKDEPLVLYCASGRRAQSAAEQLRALGYTNVTAMTGGYKDLKAAGLPVIEDAGGPSG
jgi:phage shock protein E